MTERVHQVLSDILLTYSEWLDGEKLIKGEEESGDERTHDDLVHEFLESRA